MEKFDRLGSSDTGFQQVPLVHFFSEICTIVMEHQ